MNVKRLYFLPLLITAASGNAIAQADTSTDSVASEQQLENVEIKASNGHRSRFRAENTDIISIKQLVRAACCNLGESFTTNPSVDVSYSDAATGARQIKLLGLSGTYVQMLTENIPNLRGASLPYSLGYVPGQWLQSIQVSKGASSVKNGYESTTGQINVEFAKPQGIDGVRGNAYFDTQEKLETNVDASIHLNEKLSTSLLLHYENRQKDHDGNHDGFMDMPKQRQYNVMHRWAYVSPDYISQLSMRVLRDERQSGMTHHHASGTTIPHYAVGINTNRYEAQWKNAYLLQDSHNTNIALMLHGSWHDTNSMFGHTQYDVTQKNGYAQLMLESDLTPHHSLSVGASLNHDYYKEYFSQNSALQSLPTETTTGLYAQYTYKLGDKLTVMPGLRWDYSTHYHGFVTPRLHIKYMPTSILTLRGSVGKGYRSPHALAENATLLASGRTFYTESNLKQEEAWNYGIAASFNIPIAGKTLELNTEYYYTDFTNQMVVNIDGSKGAHTVSFENLKGNSYSHTLQIDATYPFFEGFTATAAFRYNDARTTYDGILRHRPLTSRYKGLLTMSYATPMKIWQIDVTGHLNGKGDLYDHTQYPTYFQLQAQLTRDFRKFSIYLGGENLTGYKMKNPVINGNNPWGNAFDATQTWGPTDGAMVYIGVRFKFEKM